MYNDRVITTVLIDPWQQRTWKFRLPRNERIFQNLIRAGRLYECSFNIPSFNGRIYVWTNAEPTTHFGWAIEIGRDLSLEKSVWISVGDKHDPNWKARIKAFNERAVSRIEGRLYVRFQGLCLLTTDQYYRSYWWTHHLYPLIKWMPPSAQEMDPLIQDPLIQKALEIFQAERVPIDFSEL